MVRQRFESDESIWEWRMFCPIGPVPVVAQSIFERLGGRESRTTDRYVLVDGLRHNLKARKRDLQVKEFIEAHGGFQLYRRKQCYAFPLKAGQVKNILPLVENGTMNGTINCGVNCAVIDYGDITDLIQGLRREGRQVRCIEVEKRRQHFIDDDVVIEAAVLAVGLRRFWSISFEGRNLERLKSYAPDLPGGDAIIGGYVDFLGEIDKHR